MRGVGRLFSNAASQQAISPIDPQLQSAPYIGVYSDAHTNFAPTARCSTGNCTWSSFETLALCNTCQDLSRNLTNSTVRIVDRSAAPRGSYTTFYYTIGNGFGLSGIQPTSQKNVPVFVNAALLNVTSSNHGNNAFSSLAFTQGDPVNLVSVFAVGSAPGTIPEQPVDVFPSDMPFGPPVAFECLLRLCVQERQANVTNGIFHEWIVSNWTNREPQVEGSNNLSMISPKTGLRFFINGNTLDSTRIWLGQIFQGTAIAHQGSAPNRFTQDLHSSFLVLPIHTAMNQSESGFQDIMDNVANSLTLSLRTISYQSSATGDTFGWQAVVNWYWLILPIVELVATLLLLVVVMVKTSKQDLMPWSNSIIAYFFYASVAFATSAPITLGSQKEMNLKARKLLVQFESADGKGKLAVVGA